MLIFKYMCVASDSRTIVVAMLLFVENEYEICITVRSLGVSEVTRNYLINFISTKVQYFLLTYLASLQTVRRGYLASSKVDWTHPFQCIGVLSWKDWSLIVPRKVIFMVSLRSYRNQLSSAPCNYKTKMNFQKTALFVFSKCIVLGARHVRWAWLSWFCTYCDWKNGDFSYISSLTGRYKGDQKIRRLVLHTFSTLLYSILIRN